MPWRPVLPRLPPALLLATVAAAAYLNTLPAQFTFDDSFAVVHNGDVTDHSKPLLAALGNDFWGQDLRSAMSHKSYRPLTIFSFRAQHWASQLTARLLRAGREGGQSDAGGSQQEVPRPLEQGHPPQPFVFHLSNVAAHALVTALVYRLARQLAAYRRLPASGPMPPPAVLAAGSAAAPGPASGWRLAEQAEACVAALLFAVHPVHTEAVAGVVGHAELLCAALSIPALLFYMAAAEGRAGGGRRHWACVAAALALGWAAALAKEIGIAIMGAMLCYDALLAPIAPTQQPPAAAAAAAASPEPRPGRTPVQALQPCQQHAKRPAPGPAGRGSGRGGAAPAAAVAAAASQLLAAAAAPGSRSDGVSTPPEDAGLAGKAQRQGLQRKLLRMAAATAAVALYVKARSWLAGDQLVRIYRKVENPIPFAPSRLTRALTTAYLHARYAGLLIAPLQLSADWSYPCIEYVSALSDPRNLATAALYGALLAALLAAQPWRLPLEWAHAWRGGRAGRPLAAQPAASPPAAASPQPAGPGARVAAERAARWRLAVLGGLLVGPFFPASNVLFYVGTFIGERLLYFPSVGYCIILAEPLAAALQPLLERWLAGGAARAASSAGSTRTAVSPGTASTPRGLSPGVASAARGATPGAASAHGASPGLPCSSTPPSPSPGLAFSAGSGSPAGARRAPRLVWAAAAALLLAALLACFAAKTVLRNRDWLDEERLFLAAQRVCWRSGKVQLNSGIIERRYERWERAEAHFRLAQAADTEGFCEPQYHIALTLVNRNLSAAIEHLERAVLCKYTAADAVKALNQIYQQLLARSPEHAATLMERWGQLLARPQLQRFTEAATYFEGGAAKAASPGQALAIIGRALALFRGTEPVTEGRTPEAPVRVAATRRQLDLLARCMEARGEVIAAMAAEAGRGGNPGRSRAVKKVAYSYLRRHGEACRQPMAMPQGADPRDAAARSTYHTALLHTLQEADVDDPWLQQEWGLLLAAGGRGQEALPHLEVAGHILAAQLLPADAAAARGVRRGGVLSSAANGPIGEAEAGAAAAAAFRHARAVAHGLVGEAGGTGGGPAARLAAVCHLAQLECGVAARQAELAQLAAAQHQQPAEGEQQVEQRAAARQGEQQAAAQRLEACLAEARALGCSPQRAQAVRGQMQRREEGGRDEL